MCNFLFFLNHYRNVSSCYLHNHILPDHGKTRPPWMNIENVEKGNVATRKSFVLGSFRIWIFIRNITLHVLKILDFYLPHVYILGVNHCAGKWNEMFVIRNNKFDWKFTHDYAEIYKFLSEQVHLKYFSGCKSISMAGILLEHLQKLKPSTIPMAKFHSNLSDESDQDASTTATHLCVLLQSLLTKGFIDPFWRNMCDHKDGCTNQYHLESYIYLITCLAL